MNVVHTYSTNLGGSTSRTIAITAPQSGNSIVIVCAIRSSSTVFSGINVTDGANSYTTRVIATKSLDQRLAAIIDCLAPTAAVTSITLSPVGGTGGMLGCVAIHEVSGIVAFDNSGTGVYSASPLTVTAGRTDTSATNFVVAAISAGNNNAIQGISDPPSGYSSGAVQQNDNTNGSGECCYRINTGAVTDTVSWAIAAGAVVGDVAVLASYRGAVASVRKSQLACMGVG